MKKELSNTEKNHLLEVLQQRFQKNMHRHEGITWDEVFTKIAENENALWSLSEMEKTGGEPDVVRKSEVGFEFFDCSKESPLGRRSFCYDNEALESRKTHKPSNSAVNFAQEISIELLDESDYFYLQSLENVDLKTSSWINTPLEIRVLGGAVFGDKRFGRTFIYHNGAESYYAARGFRGKIKVG